MLTIEACAEVNQQLRQRVEEDRRRHADEITRHRNQVAFRFTGRVSSKVDVEDDKKPSKHPITGSAKSTFTG